jgi:hypothetical protein
MNAENLKRWLNVGNINITARTTTGNEIAIIEYDGKTTTLYSGPLGSGGGNGSNVSITAHTTAGNHIATLMINNTPYDLHGGVISSLTTSTGTGIYNLLGISGNTSGSRTIFNGNNKIKMNPYNGILSATTFSGTLKGTFSGSSYSTTGTGKYYLLGHSSISPTGTSYFYKNANVYMSGGTLYASSDERLKTFIENVDGDPEKIKQIPKVYFHWNNDEAKSRQLGTFAQGLEKVYPELVIKDNDDFETRGVSYDKLGVVALAGIDKLYEMIQKLQETNEKLESRIKELEDKLK